MKTQTTQKRIVKRLIACGGSFRGMTSFAKKFGFTYPQLIDADTDGKIRILGTHPKIIEVVNQ